MYNDGLQFYPWAKWITGEHAKPGEALLRAGDSTLSSHNDRENLSFAQLISFCHDVDKESLSSDADNLTDLGSGLV